jgi:hypothetical protein
VNIVRKLALALTSLTVMILLVSPASAIPPDSFTDADAMEKFGHDFEEEYWTAPDVRSEHKGGEASFAVSYAQYKSTDAFLVAFNNYTKDGKVGTLPYQLFGLHYYTPLGQEVLIGAILAFLIAFNDTHNGDQPGQNGLPDPGHDPIYYIIPFGIGETLAEEDYAPIIEPMQAKKMGEGHYRFGQTYRNLYAKIIGANNPLETLLSAAFPLYMAKFSELTIEYDIKIDEANGEITAETFYTIGEVSKLWVWGVDTPIEDVLTENWGLAAVHYVVTFVSKLAFQAAESKADLATNVTQVLDEDLDIRVGNDEERAFTIGHRGQYDIIDEGTGTPISENQDAMALILQSRGVDYLLIAWQAAFSLDVFCTASWAISDSLQSQYASPKALWQLGRFTFWAAPVWYATSFPGWQGNRIVHDPTYTCYADVAYKPEDDDGRVPGFGAAVALLGIAVPALLSVSRRKRG